MNQLQKLLIIGFAGIAAVYAHPNHGEDEGRGYWDLCGPSNLYSTKYQICCAGRIYQNVQGDIACCGGVAYNKTTNYCYNNQEIRSLNRAAPPNYIPPTAVNTLNPSSAVPISGPMASPISAPVSGSISAPVGSMVLPSAPSAAPSSRKDTSKPVAGYRCGSAAVDASVAVSKTTLCCGSQPFDARYQLCSDFGPAPIQAAGIQGALTVSAPEKYYTCGLDQVPSTAVTSFDSAFCCGTVVYDSRYYTCTRNNAVVPQGTTNPSGPPPQPPNRPRPSAYPPVGEGFTRVRCMSNLFDVPTNHMSHYSCCGSQAFDERHFVCTTTGSGSPRAEPINSVQPAEPQQPAEDDQQQTSTRLQCGNRIYLFGPPYYGKNMQCCGDDVYDEMVDRCIGGRKVSGVAGKK